MTSERTIHAMTQRSTCNEPRHLFFRRVVPLLVGLIVGHNGLGLAHADKLDDAVKDVLTASTQQSRNDAAKQLQKLGTGDVKGAQRILKRGQKASDGQLRAVLKAINAAVPDKKGRFRAPGRQTAKQKAAQDQLDWLPKLTELSSRPGLGDAIVDVSLIRALAATRTAHSATALYDYAFSGGLVFRDECGRYLRKMSPYSLPVLIRRANIRRKYSAKRNYARYQLERLDRENPAKALTAAAGDLELQVEVLRAIGDGVPRWGVHEVAKYLDHDVAEVRKAARATWHEYIVGKAPIDPPKKFLERAGGKKSPKPMPIWRDYRTLARFELKKRFDDIWGKTPPAGGRSLRARTKTLYAYYDDRREKRERDQVENALQAASEPELQAAVRVLDKILSEHPDHARKADMAAVYAGYANIVQSKQDWRAAGELYTKAHELSPDSADAKTLLAKSYFAFGKDAQASGKDGSELFRQAKAIEPDHRSRTVGKAADGDKAAAGPQSNWMLIAAALGGAFALALLIWGLVARKRGTAR